MKGVLINLILNGEIINADVMMTTLMFMEDVYQIPILQVMTTHQTVAQGLILIPIKENVYLVLMDVLAVIIATHANNVYQSLVTIGQLKFVLNIVEMENALSQNVMMEIIKMGMDVV